MVGERRLGGKGARFPGPGRPRGSSREANKCSHDLVEPVSKDRVRLGHVPEGHARVDACSDLQGRSEGRTMTLSPVPPTLPRAFRQIQQHAGRRPAKLPGKIAILT